MKKIFFSLLLLLSVISLKVYSYDFTYMSLNYNILSEEEKTVVIAGRQENEYTDTLKIPSEVSFNGNTYTVVAVANGAFSGHYINHIVIPATVQNIPKGSFGGRWDACAECDDWVWVYYPKSYIVSNDNPVYSSHSGILYNKDKTELLEVPYGLVQNVYLPTSLKEIPSNAFSLRAYLSNYTLYISDLSAFCQINMGTGSGIYDAFGNVKYKKDVSYYEDLCNSSGSITIPSNVTKIGNGVFCGCATIKNIKFSAMGVVEIGDYAFAKTKLTSVKLPASIQKIGNNAFYSSWTEYLESGEFDEDGDPIYDTKQWTMEMSLLEIPQNIKNIGKNAFNLSNGAIVTCKSSLPENISPNAFVNASNCKLKVMEGFGEMYKNANGWNEFGNIIEDETLFRFSDNEVFTFNSDEGVEITLKVLSVDEKTIQVGDDSKPAIDETYNGNIVLPSQIHGMTLIKIGSLAFSDCKSLASLTIPEGVLSISESCFARAKISGCLALPNTLSSIGKEAFFEAEIGEMTLPSSVNFIQTDAFSSTQFHKITIPYSSTAIQHGSSYNTYGSRLFSFNTIDTLIIDRDLVSKSGEIGSNMGYVAFYHSTINNLFENQNAGSNLYGSCTIGNYYPKETETYSQVLSFSYSQYAERYYNSSASNLYIPEGTRTISKVYCAQNIMIPSSVEAITTDAFSSCRSTLESLTSYVNEPFEYLNFWSNISTNCTLYVPAGTRDAYLAAGWTEEIFKGGVIEMESEVDENNQLLTSDVSAIRGTQVSLPIQLANTANNVVGVSYTLTLPEGVTAATDEDSELVYTLNDSRVNNKHFSVTAAQQTDGSWGVRLYTTNANGVIQGTEGEIMTITLNVDGAMEAGDYQISLTGNKLSLRNEDNSVSTLVLSDASSVLTVTALAMGDVNADEEVDLSDAIMVIYHTLQQTISNFHAEVADMNSDGEIDLSDAITIIYKSLGMISNQTKDREGADVLNDSFDRLTADTEGNACVLQLTNDNAYLGLQFDVELPTGIDIDDILLSNERAKDFSVFYNSVDEDTYRVMLFSAGGKAFKGTDGELLRLVTAGTGNGLLRLSNSFGVNSRLEKKHFDGININATGIRSLTTDTDKLQNSYDLSGRKANKLQNGVMIINGKKVFVK